MKMTRKNIIKIIVILILAALFLLIIPIGIKQGNELLKVDSAIETVSEMEEALSRMEGGSSDFNQTFNSASQEWQTLAEDNYDKLINHLMKSNYLNPPKDWDESSPLLDPWNRRFAIMYRLSNYERLEFIVMSKGKDGIFGTKDDVINESDKALLSTSE